MQIETYDFAKDKKSTKIPTIEGIIYDVVLKENTSILNPIFQLKLDTTPVFNYLRYLFSFYFVEDIIHITNNIYEVHCSLDVLASYRNDILSSQQFVVRSASDYNIYLRDDKMHPDFLEVVDDWTTQTSMFTGSSYIIRILGEANNDSVDAIPTYISDATGVKDLVKAVFDPLNSVNDIIDALKILICSPYNNILSVNWVPYNIVGGAAEEIKIGIMGTGVTAQHLTSAGARDFGLIHRPTPQFNDFRDFDETYTQFTLFLPCVGGVQVKPEDVYAGLGVTILLEYLTGDVIYYLYNSQTNAPLAKYKTNINANVQIGGRVGGQVTGVGNIISANAGFSLLTDALIGNYGTIGNVGSRLDISTFNTLRLTRRVRGTSQYGTPRVGRPLYELRTLSSLNGYCQCESAKLDTSAYGEVKEQIIDYMNNGFIIE